MILQGRNLIIKVGGVAIAAAKACSINVQAEQIPVSSPTSGEWEEYRNGRKKWTVNCNHLITNIAINAQMVGTRVSLEMSVEGVTGLPFDGFVNNVTVQSASWQETPDGIVWDKTRKKFLAVVYHYQTQTFDYYSSWLNCSQYANPSAYQTFICDGAVYTWLSNELYTEKLTGDANVETWQGDGAVGSLAKGQFTFRGTGPLTPASLPSS